MFSYFRPLNILLRKYSDSYQYKLFVIKKLIKCFVGLPVLRKPT